MRLLVLFCCLGAALHAADAATWHVTAQLYSLHEHTTHDDLTNDTPGLGVMRRSPTNYVTPATPTGANNGGSGACSPVASPA
jgi:hypothetical protein